MKVIKRKDLGIHKDYLACGECGKTVGDLINLEAKEFRGGDYVNLCQDCLISALKLIKGGLNE